MSETRYSFRTCARYAGITETAIQYRANQLGLDTSRGITASQLKQIVEYKRKERVAKRGDFSELVEEMEALK